MSTISNERKWRISIFSGLLLFALLALPIVFQLVSKLTEKIGFSLVDSNGTPTMVGVLINAVVYTLIVYLSMK